MPKKSSPYYLFPPFLGSCGITASIAATVGKPNLRKTLCRLSHPEPSFVTDENLLDEIQDEDQDEEAGNGVEEM